MKQVPNHRNLYASKSGVIYRHKNGKFVPCRVYIDPQGRPRVNTFYEDGRRHKAIVAHLVLSAYMGRRPDGLDSCHYDDNPLNNDLKNLRWDTRKNNFVDRERNGNTAWGQRNGRSKLTQKQVDEIRRLYAEGMLQYKIAEKYGVHRWNVSKIVRNLTWRQR